MMRVDQDMRSVPAGYAVFLDSYDAHSFHTDKTSTCAIIEFFPEFCREVYAPFYNWLSNHKIADKVIKIPDAIMNCVLYLLPQDVEYMKYYDELPSQFFAILAPLFFAIMTESKCVVEKNKTDRAYVRAAEYIVENYDKDLSRDTVAAEVGVTPQSLSRIFSNRMQMTFGEYVQYVRLNISLRRLEERNTISAAAYSSGFESVRSYNRAFKKFFHKTPSEYLKTL